MNGPEVRKSGSPEVQEALRRAVALASAAPDGVAYLVLREDLDLPADPLALFGRLPDARTLLWDEQGWLLASGAVAGLCADGPGRGHALAAEQARITALTVQQPAAANRQPLLLTAWAFEDTPPGPSHWGAHLPGARLWLPQRCWRRRRGVGEYLTATRVLAGESLDAILARIETDGLPDSRTSGLPAPSWPPLASDYRNDVDDATTLIRDGALKKVVLSRAVDETLPASLDATTILARLRLADPGATVFAHDLADAGIFVGATPELLFAATGARVTAMALAGSAPRDDDDRRMAELLDSTKNRKEHGLVVEHLVGVLLPRCAPFAVPGSPRPRQVGNLLHLESLLSAELVRSDHLELLAALHPTPAVCGLPAATAAHYLMRRERLHRGLYAGVLGWLSADDSRCIVPLRCGILAAGRARLFAGAGIVETSEAEAEWAETELKLLVMRRALAP